MNTELQEKFTEQLVQDGSKSITVEMDVVEAVSVVAQVQLAMRHPDNPAVDNARLFCKQLIAGVREINAQIADIMELGFDPEHDS